MTVICINIDRIVHNTRDAHVYRQVIHKVQINSINNNFLQISRRLRSILPLIVYMYNFILKKFL